MNKNSPDVIGVFLPCRSGSERVPKKNVKKFASYEGGLIELKLAQLVSAEELDYVLISSDEVGVLECAQAFQAGHGEKIRIHEREKSLCLNTTTTDQLIQHAASVMGDSDVILWTHVTSPFFDGLSYSRALSQYQSAIKTGYDSLMTVNKLTGFIWDESGPVNYDRSPVKWPFTQTIKPMYEVNSACFIASRKIYEERIDRIGSTPFLQYNTAETLFDRLRSATQ